MFKLALKPMHKPVLAYYDALQKFSDLDVTHETAVRSAFQSLLETCARQRGWTLVPEWEITRPKQPSVRADGALMDSYRIVYGYWEAKDSEDDLEKEVVKKFKAGYPQDNILFQSPDHAILYQDGTKILDADLTDPEKLIHILDAFFSYTQPAFEEWEKAASEFSQRVPELGKGLGELIAEQRLTNKGFIAKFNDFANLCRASINPNISVAAVEEMLIQHLLTERLFRTVFKNPEFVKRNVIANEIEKVIDSLASKSFSRAEFLKKLDRFYRAIEDTAASITDFSQKQTFLNTVYEKFFQGFSVKVADTMGIVYTPPSIVRFMVNSVQEILKREFGKSLGHRDVHILDPFVGTGNYIVHLMREIPKTNLAHKFKAELHANEIMLLPYYIACMNIEHEYFEATGEYEPFTGICLVDTFETAEGGHGEFGFFNEENSARVQCQKKSPIFVVIGNPPYNTNQADENDNNKNRKYKVVDGRIAATYAADSKATLRNKLSDPYIKAFRWASDRIGNEGIVAFVSNGGFLDGIACDGMRKNLAEDFDALYILDLGGNVRNPKLSGTTHNVFGIQVGVSINLLVRKRADKNKSPAKPAIYYAATTTDWRREEKYRFLEEKKSVNGIKWERIKPDDRLTWLRHGLEDDFETFIPLGTKLAKQADVSGGEETIFKNYSLGVSTNRDSVVYDFNREALAKRVEQFCDDYNAEVARYEAKGKPDNVDDFVRTDKVNWSETLKRLLKSGREATFDESKIRPATYPPFTRACLYFDHLLIDRPGLSGSFFPAVTKAAENRALCLSDLGLRSPFSVLATNQIPDLHLCASTDAFQCFPFYTYAEDGTHRRENVTDWALKEFQTHYGDKKISKWDIFHYVYAVLHHPQYRERYAANLRRALPRVPFAKDFRAFAKAGKKLADLHVGYEQQAEHPLDKVETPGEKLNYHVEKMKLTKDKTAIIYNSFLTLAGIPKEAFEYRLGNRSALDWVIDQYQVSTDKRSGITSDPNRADDEQYILRLIGQVITVSVETVKIVKSLPELKFD
jgi:predicted helicase